MYIACEVHNVLYKCIYYVEVNIDICHFKNISVSFWASVNRCKLLCSLSIWNFCLCTFLWLSFLAILFSLHVKKFIYYYRSLNQLSLTHLLSSVRGVACTRTGPRTTEVMKWVQLAWSHDSSIILPFAYSKLSLTLSQLLITSPSQRLKCRQRFPANPRSYHLFNHAHIHEPAHQP